MIEQITAAYQTLGLWGILWPSVQLTVALYMIHLYQKYHKFPELYGLRT